MWRWVFAVGVVLSGVQPTAAAAAPEPPAARFVHAREPIAGEYLVVLRPDAHASLRESAEPEREAEALFGTPARRVWSRLPVFLARTDEAGARRLRSDPRVRYVEENGLVRALEVQEEPTWGLDRIDQEKRPVDGSYRYVYTGRGVTAYVIDSGIRASHAEFGGRVLHGAYAIDDGNGSDDCDGHGTHVAATIGGATFGVAKDVELVPVRVLGCDGFGDTSGVIDAVEWVIENARHPAVANMSIGSGDSPALDEAVEALIASGIAVAAAAGNDDDDTCLFSPGRVPAAITVGATNKADGRATFSNWGTCVDVFAPGVKITSAGIDSDTSQATMDGTSMATPHVAGFLALLLEQDPARTPAELADHVAEKATEGELTNARGSPDRILCSCFAEPKHEDGGALSCSVTTTERGGFRLLLPLALCVAIFLRKPSHSMR